MFTIVGKHFDLVIGKLNHTTRSIYLQKKSDYRPDGARWQAQQSPQITTKTEYRRLSQEAKNLYLHMKNGSFLEKGHVLTKGLLMKMRWSLVRPHKLQMTARNNTVVLTASNKQHQAATNQLPTVITS